MILVVGGTGHLGTALIPRLLARGGQVRVFTRDVARAQERLGRGPEFAQGDVRDRASVDVALRGVETVVSAVTGFGPGGGGVRAVDLQGNLNVIHAAEAAGVRRYVFVSMHGASSNHVMELLRKKHEVEEALQASRLDWTIVRPTVFMELWTGIVGDPMAKSGKATVFGRGDNPINFSSVHDIARCVETAIFEPGPIRSVLEIGGPENVTLNGLVQRIEQALGKQARVKHIPLPVMRIAARLMRPIRRDIAGMIQAGIAMDTSDMTFDPRREPRAFPENELTTLSSVIDGQFRSHQTEPADAVSRAGSATSALHPR